MHTLAHPITVTYQPTELGFLFCGNCGILVDPFNPKTRNDQHACCNGHLVCDTCALRDRICKTCATDITPIIPVADDPAHSPAYFMRKLIRACTHVSCTYTTIDPDILAYHTHFACPYRPGNARTLSAPPASYTVSTTLSAVIDLTDKGKLHGIQFVHDMPYDTKLAVRIRYDLRTHTLNPIYVSEDVALIITGALFVAFHILTPDCTRPIRQPIPGKRAAFTIVPLFQTPHPDPARWMLTNAAFNACAYTVAHSTPTFVSYLQRYIHHQWAPSETPGLVPFQPVKPICLRSPISTFALLTDGIYFAVPFAPDPFVFKIKQDLTATIVLAQCPSCFAYMPFQPDFCDHIHVDPAAVLRHAYRVSTAAALAPCAKQLWASDLAHELLTPAIRDQIDIFPMLAAVRACVDNNEPVSTYFGALLKINGRHKLAAFTYNQSGHILCALCNHADTVHTRASVAAHFNISQDDTHKFTEMVFNPNYTHYTFLPTSHAPIGR